MEIKEVRKQVELFPMILPTVRKHIGLKLLGNCRTRTFWDCNQKVSIYLQNVGKNETFCNCNHEFSIQ